VAEGRPPKRPPQAPFPILCDEEYRRAGRDDGTREADRRRDVGVAMSTEPSGMEPASGADPARQRRRAPWAAVSMVAGAAFAVIALLHAPGIAYAIVAIVAGLAYSLVHMYSRRDV